MTEWLDHSGKGMPVPRTTKVGVRMRDGSETPKGMFFPASGWAWTWADEDAPHFNRSLDILAYCLADQQETTA